MPVFSINSNYGIGAFSEEAYRFIDWLSESGFEYWQILPLGPTGFGDSPYQSFSAFAGNPYFISLDKLVSDGLLNKNDLNFIDFGNDVNHIDYGKLYNNRYPLLKKAFNNWCADDNFYKFENENSFWLKDYAIFMAIKNKIDSSLWINWNEKYKFRKFSDDDCLKDEILFQKFMQYVFYCQWNELKEYANKLGIKIIGDIPIYVSLDSSDAWSLPELFQFDKELNPTFVAGCPPDGFSKKGQLWGNPLYDWEYHKKTNYEWWENRFKHSLQLFDGIRIDHFRGFDKYYSIPYGSPDACDGKWIDGPSYDLFDAVNSLFENRVIIAEDLGFITDSVKKLLLKTGFMSTKVIEFAFDKRDNDRDNVHMPHNYTKNCVSYTSTHDNETLAGWIDNLTDCELLQIRKYLYDLTGSKNLLYKSFITTCMRSCADLCVLPIQDILGLDNSSRINTPSTTGNNWTWRIGKNSLTTEISCEMKDIIKTYYRNSKKHQSD